MRRSLVAIVVCSLVLFADHEVSAQENAITACQDAAGNPYEPESAGRGREFDQIDGDAAVLVCRDALAQEPGSVATKYRLARALLVAGLPQEALQLALEAAKGDYAPAKVLLGFIYGSGRGVTQDDARAVHWYRLAAEQGYAPAQLALGDMYFDGLGVPQDDAQAAYWYRLAAEQGNLDAQSNLGSMYEYGRGVAQDDTQAVHWYRLAAEQGHADGQVSLGWMYEYGRGVVQDDAQAVYWYRLAAEQGAPYGQNNLGVMYENGRGGLWEDDVEAVHWFRMAAEQGNMLGQYNLGLMYEAGTGVERDIDQAVHWIGLSADQGYLDAQDKLAELTSGPQGQWQADFWCWSELVEWEDWSTFETWYEDVTFCEDEFGGVWERDNIFDPCMGVEGWCDVDGAAR